MSNTKVLASPISVNVGHFVGDWNASESEANASVLEQVDAYVVAAVQCGLDADEISTDLAAEFADRFSAAEVKMFSTRAGIYAEVSLAARAA